MAPIKMTSEVVLLLILSYSCKTSNGNCIAKFRRGDEFCQAENITLAKDPMKLTSSNQTITLSQTSGLNPHSKLPDIDNGACLLSSHMGNDLLEVDLVKDHHINPQLSSTNKSSFVDVAKNGTYLSNANHYGVNSFDSMMYQSNGMSGSPISGEQYQRIKRLTAEVANRSKPHKHHVVKRKSTHHMHHSHHQHKRRHQPHGDGIMVVM